MKKLLSVILALSMILSLVCVAQAVPVAEKFGGTNIVNVTGKVAEGSTVCLLLLDAQDNVKHVQEVKTGADGTYRAKFKYSESTDGLKLQVKQGAEDVTDSVISAVSESEVLTYTFGATTLKTNTIATAEFKNFFNITGKTYVVMVAFYDKDRKLISVKSTGDKSVGFDETSTEVVIDIPEGTEEVTSFLWDGTKTMIPLVKEKTTRPAKELKVLAIGNSFMDDPTAYLLPIARADGVELKLTKAGQGGASIWQHWMYNKMGKGFYGTKTVDGEKMTPEHPENTGEWTYTLNDYLDPNGVKNTVGYYDIVIFQQVSGDSGKIASYGFDEHGAGEKYDNCAENLAKLIRSYQPTAEIVLQETWAYEIGYSPLKNNYSLDGKNDINAQNNMYNKIVETVNYACERLAKVTTDDGAPISLNGKPLRYIPTGDAFQNARKNVAFQTERDSSKFYNDVLDEREYVSLHRDGFHSSHLYGRYLGGLVWYGALTGNSPVANKYSHLYDMKLTDGTTLRLYPDPDLAEVIKQAAQDALDNYGRWN